MNFPGSYTSDAEVRCCDFGTVVILLFDRKLDARFDERLERPQKVGGTEGLMIFSTHSAADPGLFWPSMLGGSIRLGVN